MALGFNLRQNRPGRLLAASAALGLAMWSPVFYEEWRGDPGNLSVIWHLKSVTEEKSWGRESLAAGVAALAETAWAPFGYTGGSRLADGDVPRALLFAALLLALAAAAALLAWRARLAAGGAPASCLLALPAGAFWTLASSSGEFHPYLTRFLVPVGPLLWILLGGALLATWPEPQVASRYSAAAIAALLAATGALAFLACREIQRTSPLENSRARPGRDGMGSGGRHHPRRPRTGRHPLSLYRFRSRLLALHRGDRHPGGKRGGHALVHEDWEFMFGAEHLAGAHDGLLLLDYIEAPAEPAPAPAVLVTEAPSPPPCCRCRRPSPTAAAAAWPPATPTSRFSWIPASIRPSRRPASRPPAGPGSTLRGSAFACCPAAPTRFAFEAAPHEATLPQTAEVTVNGRRLGEIAIGAGWRRYALEIPGDLVRPVNEVVLRYGTLVVPSAVSESRDNRCLALSFRSLCFEELRFDESPPH